MVVRKKIIKAVASKNYRGVSDSRSRDIKENQSKARTYKAGVIEKNTVILKAEKDDFIYKYNVKHHGGLGKKVSDDTISEDIDWVEKV